MEPCCGSSVTRTTETLLMFPLGSVISEHTMPKGSGLVWCRRLEIYLGEAERGVLVENVQEQQTQQSLKVTRKVVGF